MAKFTQIKLYSPKFGLYLSFAILTFAFGLLLLIALHVEVNNLFVIEQRVINLLSFTLTQATLSTFISLLVGLILAWSLAHQRSFPLRGVLIALLSSSLVLPTMVVVFGLISILGQNGWINRALLYLFDVSLDGYVYGLSGILIAHVYLNASYVSRALLHNLETIPDQRYKLAKSLGLSVFERFLLVELPAISATLKSISATVFLLCFSSFAIVLTLGGSPKYNTLEVALYEAIRLDFDIAFGLKLALIQLSIGSLLVLLFSNFKVEFSNIRDGFLNIEEKRGVKIFQILCIALLSFLFVLPLLAIFVDGFGADFQKILSSPIFLKSLITSLFIAFISAVLTLFSVLLLSEAKRSFTLNGRTKNKTLSLLISFSTNLYLAIPSLIIGLGFFMLSQKIEINQTIVAYLALITANFLLSLPFSMSIIYPIMQKVAIRYDRLSFVLGLRGIRRFWLCEWHYLKAPMAYVFGLSFCLSLGDLGVIALFGSQDITTLPWYLYQLLGSYHSKDGAGVALLLLVLTLVVFLLANKGEKNVKN